MMETIMTWAGQYPGLAIGAPVSWAIGFTLHGCILNAHDEPRVYKLAWMIFWPIVTPVWLATLPARALVRWWRGRKVLSPFAQSVKALLDGPHEDWKCGGCTAKHKDGLVLWTANGAWFLKTYDGSTAHGDFTRRDRRILWRAFNDMNARKAAPACMKPKPPADGAPAMPEWKPTKAQREMYERAMAARDHTGASGGGLGWFGMPISFGGVGPVNYATLKAIEAERRVPYGSKPSEDARPVTRKEFDAAIETRSSVAYADHLAERVIERFERAESRLAALEARAGGGEVRGWKRLGEATGTQTLYWLYVAPRGWWFNDAVNGWVFYGTDGPGGANDLMFPWPDIWRELSHAEARALDEERRKA